MKKLFTTMAMAALALSTQAQITVDGQITEEEIGENGYQLVGEVATPGGGFGDWGIRSLYLANDATHLYVGLIGTVEKNGNSFQFYFNVPDVFGVEAGTQLPSGGDGSSFQSNNATMDFEVDYATAFRYADGAEDDPSVFAVAYTQGGEATTIEFGQVSDDEMENTLTAVTGPDLFNGTTIAYAGRDRLLENADFPDDVIADENDGLEWKISLEALGLSSGESVQIFVAMNNADGGFFSDDFVPDSDSPDDTNLGTNPDFGDIDGSQFATFSVVTSLRAPSALSGMNVYPNPATSRATIRYDVAGSQPVSVKVFDLIGNEVATLAESARQSGAQALSLNTKNLSAGLYFVRIEMPDGIATKRLNVIR